ncbi:50S ribosomal protein L4 [Caminibacter sp.]
MSVKVINQLPEDFQNINPHNLYLYVKAYLANQRAGTAHTKTRGEVSGGGKKPFRQKGLGRARQGSIRAPHFVGGGVAHGPRNERDWSQKINKKQKRVALKYALNEKAENSKIYVVPEVKIESGKTKDAAKWLAENFNERDYLIVVDSMDDKTYLAFRNIPNVWVITPEELNAYYASVFKSIIFDEAAFDKVIKG